MILLKDKPDVTPVGGTYPYGAIKDDTGINDGTPVNKEVYDDFHQFFERMFDKSGLTANGLPDNNTDGFQLFEALEKLSTDLKYRGTQYINALFKLNAATNEHTSGYASFNFITKLIEIETEFGTSYSNIFTSLGDANVGTEVYFRLMSTNNSAIRFHINSTNLGGFPIIRKDGVTGSNTLITLSGLTDKTILFVKMNDHWRYYDL
jgi:hypothetical protein